MKKNGNGNKERDRGEAVVFAP
eukprot:COSAG06_NODE_46342_length_347_cov_1.451613_1_plen_21_part_10